MNATIGAAPVQVAPPVKATVAPSSYDQVRNGAVKAANWLGRQVQCICSTVTNTTLRIVKWAKPFFTGVMKVLGEAYDKIRELMIANKEIAIPATIVAVIAVVAALSFNHLFCSGEATEAPPATA